MSDYRAIAASLATLQNTLRAAIRDAVPGAEVRTGPPKEFPPNEVEAGLVNIFLYRIHPNMTWRNEELPFRNREGGFVRKPQLALDLHFLFSFYGPDEPDQIPAQLLGLTLSTFHAEPYLQLQFLPAPGDGIRGESGLQQDPEPHKNLAGSGLDEQVHPFYVTLSSLGHQDLSQIWAIFNQVPYVTTVGYVGTVILLQPDVVPQPSLPVRRTDVYFPRTHRPSLERLRPQLQPYGPTAQLTLEGSNLDAPTLRVSFGTLETEPSSSSSDSVTVALPQGLQAGVRQVMVSYREPSTSPGSENPDWVSNPLPFTLLPVIRQATWTPLPPAEAADSSTIPPDDDEPETRRGHLDLRIAPEAVLKTSASVLLNPLATNTEEQRRGYVFPGSIEPERPGQLSIEIEVAPGTYLVRVRIHQVESPLSINHDPTSPSFGFFHFPQVEIS